MQDQTILIFDSGVGGLYFYEELRVFLPFVRYIYFFDNECFPYGERSSKFILDRLINIFREIYRRHKLDLVVIACNTVTVLLLEKLRSYFFFPIIGVVPDIYSGMQCTRNGIIGLLATYKTVSSKFISDIINQFSLSYHFLLLSSSELVCAVENKILYGKSIEIMLLREILTPWLNIFKQPDTIILGCTHFLYLQNELNMIFPKKIFLVGISKSIIYYIIRFFIIKNINVMKFRVCKVDNQMYCTVITKKIFLVWHPILLKYNFSSLSKITILILIFLKC